MKLLKIISLIATIAFGGVVLFFVWFGVAMWKDEERAAQKREDQRSGKEDFGDHPALFAVAQAIVRNDQEGIRAAAKNVPDLNAAGRDGTTLLYFAVRQTWHKEHWGESVRTLLSLGANPNYNNGQKNSFALAEAGEASVLVLRAMLDGGGDPNGRDVEGVPIILSNWDVSYYTDTQSHSRFVLLLERGADINSTMPETGPCCPGYSLVLYRTAKGFGDERAYADALYLLERGADPNRVANNGMTLAKKLMEHREHFAREKKEPPREFERLWEWAQTHGFFSPPQP